MLNNNVDSFKLVVKPGDKKLRSSDYWAILALCAGGAFVLFLVVGQSI